MAACSSVLSRDCATSTLAATFGPSVAGEVCVLAASGEMFRLGLAGAFIGGTMARAQRPGNFLGARWSEAIMDSDIVLWGGLDPAGEAGLAADLEMCNFMGIQPRIVLTARTAQRTGVWVDAWAVDGDEVSRVTEALPKAAYGRRAVKTGMLGSIANMLLCKRFCGESGLPLIVDPVWRASSGGSMWPTDDEAEVRAAMLNDLLPGATCVTPNWMELQWLTGLLYNDLDGAVAAMRILPCPVVLKGGHAPDHRLVGVDLLWDGEKLHVYEPVARAWPRGLRGTGCRFATGLAAGIARRQGLPAAVDGAKGGLRDLVEKRACISRV